MKCPFCKREIPGAHVHQPVVFSGFIRFVNTKRGILDRQEVIKQKTLPRNKSTITQADRVPLIIVRDWM